MFLEGLVENIRQNPRDSLSRKVLADWFEEHDSPQLANIIRRFGHIGTQFKSGDGSGGGGYGGGGGDGGGHGGGGDGGGHGGGDGGKTILVSEGVYMRNGLNIICIPSGYYPLVRIGWCTREDLFVTIRNCRVIRWFGTNVQLAQLAKEGPASGTVLLDMMEEESACLTECGRVIPCDPKKWIKECPEPV